MNIKEQIKDLHISKRIYRNFLSEDSNFKVYFKDKLDSFKKKLIHIGIKYNKKGLMPYTFTKGAYTFIGIKYWFIKLDTFEDGELEEFLELCK